jgi:hypothetical protein
MKLSKLKQQLLNIRIHWKLISYSVIILILLLFGCRMQPNFTINGSFPDRSYDGELIFLTPLVNYVRERVDSVPVVNGGFLFKGRVETPEIYILRVKPAFRLAIQDLIVVKEPGELTVSMGSNSSSHGTPLNDSLQYWKEKKMKTDTLYSTLYHQFISADETLKPFFKQRTDSLHAAMIDFHFNFVKNNQDNVVGDFVFKMMGGDFSPDQKKSLNFK